MEPFCRACRVDGLLVRATVADHIQPHGGDPLRFWSGELQSLCRRHSNEKTAREVAERRR